ncbi:MAG: tetraacyldisaccharide 4'-kinase [Pseudorhodoplanes sp.]|uniref:tetraacyldisaccharide 4'-kinase n=1 Tax=Pseudorhodoplanes sp. TaxID=1934341 RepID=UPI003D0EEE3F
MREPDFWWRKPGIAAWLLSPLAWIYGAISGWRMRHAGWRSDVPVICVGNFTLGGTGKTPSAIAIGAILAAGGDRPFFLTRGYGGRLAGPIRVDPASHRAADVGDEPLLLARHHPTIVSRDRPAGAEMARAAGATVIVMDDGLQNPSLHKDLSIAVVDARRGFGNARVFPAGPLRAPLAMQFAQAHAILLIGKGAAAGPVSELARTYRRPLLRAQLEPARDAAKAIGRRKALAFAGIGDPEKFFMTLASAGIEATIEESFSDHHPYSEDEAARILARCESQKLVPVTTEKDAVRLFGQDGARGRLAAVAKVIPVTLILEEPDLLRKLVSKPIAGR